MDTLLRVIAKWPEDERREALGDMARLIELAENTPPSIGMCYDWATKVYGNYLGETEAFEVETEPYEYFWKFRIGGPAGHLVVKVTFADGTVFYLDNGYWGPYFTPDDIPWGWCPCGWEWEGWRDFEWWPHGG